MDVKHMNTHRKYCFALDLKNNIKIIKVYKAYHQKVSLEIQKT